MRRLVRVTSASVLTKLPKVFFWAEVESCVREERFTKDGKEFAVEDDGGYSVVFRCKAPKEEGEGTNHVLLKMVGSTYQIVNMTSRAVK